MKSRWDAEERVAPAAENAICDWGEFVSDSVCDPCALRQDIKDQKWLSRKWGLIIMVIQDVEQGRPRLLPRSSKTFTKVIQYV